MRNNWFEICYYCLNLVAFATIEQSPIKENNNNNNNNNNYYYYYYW